MRDSMTIVTAAGKSAWAARNWKGQYYDEQHGWSKTFSGDSEQTYKKILAAEGDPDKIEAAVGNSSWSHVHCGMCGEKKYIAVSFDSGDGTVEICNVCLKSAQAALNAVTATASSK